MKKNQVTLIYPGQGTMTQARKSWLGKKISLRLPLPILFLAPPLQKKGYTIKILDLRLDNFEQYDFSNDLCVGISALTGGQIFQGLQAAKFVKNKFKDLPIVWGGIHPTLFQEQTIKNPFVDIIVKHEGEETFSALVEVLSKEGWNESSLRNIPGIVFKDKEGIMVNNPDRSFLDFNSIELPAYDLVEMNRYFGIQNTFDYQSSRGCPFDCGFCYNKAFNKLRWRPKSAELVVDELEFLHKKYKVKEFAIVDDEFFINKNRDTKIVELLIEREQRFKWSAFCRFDSFSRLDSSFLIKLKESGMEQIWMGAESGNIDVLNYYTKKIEIDQILDAARRTQDIGIKPAVSFMMGSIKESEKSINDTLNLYDKIIELNPLAEINGIFVYTPYPGTNMYDDSINNGFNPPQSLEEWGTWEFNYKFNHKWLDKKLLEKIKIIGYIARFNFFTREFLYRNRNNKTAIMIYKFFSFPFIISVKIRWSRRFFNFAYEWKLWAFVVRKMIGFI